MPAMARGLQPRIHKITCEGYCRKDFTHYSEVKMYPMTFLAMLRLAPTKHATMTVLDKRNKKLANFVNKVEYVYFQEQCAYFNHQVNTRN